MIKSERLHLRKINSNDLDILLKWENDKINHQFSESPTYYTKEHMQAFVESTQDLFVNNQLRLMIDFEKNIVGCIDLFEFDPFHLRAGVGILIDRQFRKKGFAKESILLLEKYAFKIMGINQLHCKISSSNRGSVLLFESCGFLKSGHLKSWIKRKNSFEDVLIYQKLNSKQQPFKGF
ncbi:MAG: GNAT family protein [Bacteroidota bacterium]|nr:GNAT family protein [Bacteroidota bacterium]